MQRVPSAVKRAAQAAPGARVTVVTPKDGTFLLDQQAPPGDEWTGEPGMAEMLLAMLQRDQLRDREAIGALALSLGKINATVADMGTAMQIALRVQHDLGITLAKLTETLTHPVEPIYDVRGKLIGAQRVEKLTERKS